MKYFEFGPVVVWNMWFKVIPYLGLLWPLSWLSRRTCAILVEGIMRKISLKFFF